MRFFVARALTVTVIGIGMGSQLFAGLALAEEMPQTKCVTKTSLGQKASAEAQFTKDSGPYEKSAPAAIAAYRESLGIAWAAMEEPYCGFGSYGATSAYKSYAKNIVRARTIFLEAVKTASQQKVILVSDPPKVTATATSVIAPPKQPMAPITQTSSLPPVAVLRQLRRGVRSDAVRQVQVVLAKVFAVSEKDLVTGYFGPKTEQWIISYQLKRGIISSKTSPGAGLIGPKTATALAQE